jgi:general stress protein YciG
MVSGKGRGVKGFGSMDEERKRMIASKGGYASAKGNNTSNRGFASMDRNKQREISSMGGKASRNSHSPSVEKNEKHEEDAEQSDIIREKDASIKDLGSLKDEDDLESPEETKDSLSYSETDEDEDEGLGDGNLGRSSRESVSGK